MFTSAGRFLSSQSWTLVFCVRDSVLRAAFLLRYPVCKL